MLLLLVFIFFLILENLFLPALIGPGPFLATQIFILAVIVYSKSWKELAVTALLFILIKEFVSGNGVGSLMVPFFITAGLYLIINRFLNIRDNLAENNSLSGLIVSTLVLVSFNFIYAWFYILYHAASYNVGSAWNYWVSLPMMSLFSTLGWSVGISILFKYVLKTK